MHKTLLLVSVLVLFSSLGMVSAATQLSSCGVISQPGSFELAQDVFTTAACFEVRANDVKVDCGDKTISLGGNAIGFRVVSRNGFELRNCVVNTSLYADSPTAILLSGSNYSVHQYNRIEFASDRGRGVDLSNSHNGTIADNAFVRGSYGVYSVYSSGVQVLRNTFLSTATDNTYGISLFFGSRNFSFAHNSFNVRFGIQYSSGAPQGLFYNNSFSGAWVPILFVSTAVTAEAASFSGSRNWDVQLNDGSQVALLNHSAAPSLRPAWFGSPSTLDVEWWALANVTAANGAPAIATVTAYDAQGTLVASNSTFPSGFAFLRLKEKRLTNSGQHSFTPHRFVVSSTGQPEEFRATVNRSGYYDFVLGTGAPINTPAPPTPTPTATPTITPTPSITPTPFPTPTPPPTSPPPSPAPSRLTCSQLGGRPCNYANESCPGNRWLDASDYASCCQTACIPQEPLEPTPPPACFDGTSFGNCSGLRPFFCGDGLLLENCVACGCPSMLSCNADSKACEPVAGQSASAKPETYKPVNLLEPQLKLRRLHEMGANASEEEALLRRYLELKKAGRDAEADSVLARFNSLADKILYAPSGGGSNWLSLVAFLLVVVLVGVALFYSEAVSSYATKLFNTGKPPSAPPQQDSGLSGKLAELRKKLGG